MKAIWGTLVVGLMLGTVGAQAAAPKLKPIWNQDMKIEILENSASGAHVRTYQYVARLRVFEDMDPPKGISRAYTCEVTLPDDTGSPDRLKYPCTFTQNLCVCSSVKFAPVVANEFLKALMGKRAPTINADDGEFELASTHALSFGMLGGYMALDRRYWLKTWAGANRTGTDNADI